MELHVIYLKIINIAFENVFTNPCTRAHIHYYTWDNIFYCLYYLILFDIFAIVIIIPILWRFTAVVNERINGGKQHKILFVSIKTDTMHMKKDENGKC